MEKTVSITSARSQLLKLSKQVVRHMDRYVLTNKGVAEAVLLSVGEYKSLRAAAELAGTSGSAGRYAARALSRSSWARASRSNSAFAQKRRIKRLWPQPRRMSAPDEKWSSLRLRLNG